MTGVVSSFGGLLFIFDASLTLPPSHSLPPSYRCSAPVLCSGPACSAVCRPGHFRIPHKVAGNIIITLVLIYHTARYCLQESTRNIGSVFLDILTVTCW